MLKINFSTKHNVKINWKSTPLVQIGQITDRVSCNVVTCSVVIFFWRAFGGRIIRTILRTHLKFVAHNVEVFAHFKFNLLFRAVPNYWIRKLVELLQFDSVTIVLIRPPGIIRSKNRYFHFSPQNILRVSFYNLVIIAITFIPLNFFAPSFVSLEGKISLSTSLCER